MSALRKTVIINATLVAFLVVLGVGLSQGPEPLMKEIRGIEVHASNMTGANPANFVSSCSALIAVFCAWRTFTTAPRPRGNRKGFLSW